jgi:hypothetical protein
MSRTLKTNQQNETKQNIQPKGNRILKNTANYRITHMLLAKYETTINQREKNGQKCASYKL